MISGTTQLYIFARHSLRIVSLSLLLQLCLCVDLPFDSSIAHGIATKSDAIGCAVILEAGSRQP